METFLLNLLKTSLLGSLAILAMRAGAGRAAERLHPLCRHG